MKQDILKTWEISNDEFIMDTTQVSMRIAYIQKDVIRLRVYKDKNSDFLQTVAGKKIRNQNFNLGKVLNGWQLVNKEFKIVIDKEPFEIKLYNDCVREALSTIYTNIQGEDSYNSMIRFELQPNERIYSLGRHNIVNLRKGYNHLHATGENRIEKKQEASRPPLMVSSRGYGIILTSFSLQQEVAEIYIVCKSKISDIKRVYEDITGQKPLYNKFIMQFVKYRNRYINEAKLFTIVKNCSTPNKHPIFVL